MSAVATTTERRRAYSVSRGRLLVIAAWALSRAYVTGAAVAIQLFGIALKPWQPGWAHHFALLVRWDGHWYRTIAASGYLILPGHHSDPAFFPLYPLVLRIAQPLGLSENAVGLVVSNVASLGALLLLRELALEWVGDETATRTAVLLSVFPFSIVFSMVYPEGLGLFLILGAALAARRGRWGVATVAAFAAGLTRPEAVAYAIPLAGIALSQRRVLTGTRAGVAAAAVLAAPAGTATFSLYLWQATGSATAWQASERTWGRPGGLGAPWHAFAALVEQPSPWLYRDTAATVLYLAGLALAYRAGVPRTWVAAGAAVVLLPVLTGSFESIGRYGLLAPAAFAGFASLLRTRRRWWSAVLVCVVLAFGALVSLTVSAP